MTNDFIKSVENIVKFINEVDMKELKDLVCGFDQGESVNNINQ